MGELMTILRAYRAADMRDMIFDGDFVTRDADRIVLVEGDGQTTTFYGSFGYGGLGAVSGTLTGYSQRVAGSLVFAAKEVDVHASTSMRLAAEADNDAFAAYTLFRGDSLYGSGEEDYLLGMGGEDRLWGHNGDDKLFGGSGDDRIKGGSGADLLAGGLGVDRLEGGRGHDTYIVDEKRDRVIEASGEGTDLVLASTSFTLAAHVENLGLTGKAAIDGRGNDLGNEMNGNGAENILRGLHGHDRLYGGGGDDTLIGGQGRDRLTGGAGADEFQFGTASHAKGDLIRDFHANDVIDLRRIDADSSRDGDQGFRFIGSARFSGDAAQLRADDGLVQGDLDGDGRADFAFEVIAGFDLGRGDFHL